MEKEIEMILKAKPIRNKNVNHPFKMPKNPHLWIIDEKEGEKILVKNFKSE